VLPARVPTTAASRKDKSSNGTSAIAGVGSLAGSDTDEADRDLVFLTMGSAAAGRRTGFERGVLLLELELDVPLEEVEDDASAGGAIVPASGSMTTSSSGMVANGSEGAASALAEIHQTVRARSDTRAGLWPGRIDGWEFMKQY